MSIFKTDGSKHHKDGHDKEKDDQKVRSLRKLSQIYS